MKEGEGRPQAEVFVVRKKKQEELLDYYTKCCRPLYGSDARVDKDGNIFYPTYHQVRREKVTPENYSLLSEKRQKGEVYLAQELVTKILYERRINRVTKDGGSVEAGIRSVEHALETELKIEKPQMEMIRGRTAELFDLFADFSAVDDEQLEKAERETYKRLDEARYDPQKVVLEEKQRMAAWLTKASGGKDSLKRRNSLITIMALGAAHRRMVKREMGIGETVSKFVRMREALCFGREFSREILEEVRQRLEPQRIPAHDLFKHPDKPLGKVGIVKGMLKTMCWQLTLPPVKPYRPAGMEARGILEEVIRLLGQDQREEIIERNLFRQTLTIIGNTLDEHKKIYPNI